MDLTFEPFLERDVTVIRKDNDVSAELDPQGFAKAFTACWPE
jgi:hypothetical protein